jgi:hypothetical protein
MAVRRTNQTAAERERDEQQFNALRKAIAEGWAIEPPVMQRPSFSNRRGSPPLLHCILVQAKQRRLVVFSDTPAARSLLAEFHVQIGEVL